MAKLADALDLGSSAARHVGSTPIFRTPQKRGPPKGPFFIVFYSRAKLFDGFFKFSPDVAP